MPPLRPDPANPEEVPGDAPAPTTGPRRVGALVALIRSSPWFVIAIALHLVIVAVMSVIYITHERKKEDASVMQASMATSKVDELPPEEKTPEVFDRQAVPENDEAEVVSEDTPQISLPDALADPNEDLTLERGLATSIPGATDGASGGSSVGVGGGGHRGARPSAYAGRGGGGGKVGRVGGPTQATQEAVLNGLKWLIRHQNENGSWSSTTLRDRCPPEQPCMPKTSVNAEAYNNRIDVGQTALAVLAFLGAGYSHDAKQNMVDTTRAKKHFLGKDVVSPALKWLVSQQAENGSFTQAGELFLYNEAIAALAMSEAYGLALPRSTWKAEAQKAIDFLCGAQRPAPSGVPGAFWGWRYVPGKDIEDARGNYPDEKAFKAALSDADLSVTGWAVMAMKSALVAGLKVPQANIDGALAFTKWVATSNGLSGYVAPEGAGIAITDAHDNYKFHPGSLAAVNMCVRTFLEHDFKDPYLKAAADQMMKDLPSAKEDKGGPPIDYYYWYYGSLALNQFDGPDSPDRTGKYWDKWNKAMQDSLLGLQDKGERTCATGGWMEPDRWAYGVGPIYVTATNVLNLEVYYRFENAFGAAKHISAPKASANDPKTSNPAADANKPK